MNRLSTPIPEGKTSQVLLFWPSGKFTQVVTITVYCILLYTVYKPKV